MNQLKALLADAQANLQTYLSRLTERERQLLGAGGAAGSLLVLLLVLVTFSSSATSYLKRTDSKLRQLDEVHALAATFRESEAQRQAEEQQLSNSNIRLVSYLEERGNQSGLSIPTMQSKADAPLGEGHIVESAVELTLTDISLGKLVDFLGKVEAGPGVVKVKYLRIEPRPANENLTAWVTIATYRLKQ